MMEMRAASNSSSNPAVEAMDLASRPRRSVKAVLFDLDGTLIDSIPLIVASLRHAMSTVLAVDLSDEQLMRNIGTPLVKQMREFSPEHADELLRVYREHNAIHHDTWVNEYPMTSETLLALKAMGYPVGVVTSKAGEGARRGLAVTGLDQYIDILVTCDDTDRHKPEPDPLYLAAERFGLKATECVYVGDSEFDMMAAKAAGAVSIAALWGPFPDETVLGPGVDHALETITGLLPLLDALNKG